MKYLVPAVSALLLLSACGEGKKDPAAEIAKLKKERAEIDQKIRTIESKGGVKDSVKSIPVSVVELQPQSFNAFIDVQAAITGDENVNASAQMMGTIKSVNARVGQRVSAGQVLATLDAAAVEQQIAAQDAQVTLARSLYEKQQKLWAQQIGTEVQLLQARANYEASSKQRGALVAQRNMYRIVAPISGVIDQVIVKQGDAVQPGAPGIRIVNNNKLKAEANLGESYLGKVQVGNPVTLVFPDSGDSLKTKLGYVAQAVDPVSRAFQVQVPLGSSAKLHPNMSARMRIANYGNSNALVVPVAAVQQTGEGAVVFVAEGGKAKSVKVQTGRNSDGNVEILGGLKAGDRVITAGFEELDNGTAVKVM
jgi:membrane fusion protein (multidrug efflux system)